MSQTQHIFVVDDEAAARDMIGDYLKMHGFGVTLCDGGASLRQALGREKPDLLILDLNMPEEDGLSIIRSLKQQASRVPIIMLTATASPIDRVVGLELGADDYVTKPFAVRELVARVRAIMRRAAVPAGQRPDELVYDRLRINLPSRRVSVDGGEVDLTYTEFELLVTLASSPGRVFSRSALLRRVWGDEFRDERTVDVHIRHLREKIERDPRNPEFIHTARGVGYVFR